MATVEPLRPLFESKKPTDAKSSIILNECSDISEISEAIRDSTVCITQRMRALFLARHAGGEAAVEALIGGLRLQPASVLFRHEIAYVLGQLGNSTAIETLNDLLDDLEEDDMVRHEAAEALAAIGSQESIELLIKHSHDKVAPVRETCELALVSLRGETRSASDDGPSSGRMSAPVQENHTDSSNKRSPYNTVDPICPNLQCSEEDCLALSHLLNNASASLCRRYEALFALRNLGSDKASQVSCPCYYCTNSDTVSEVSVRI
eukprot:GHVQ01015191.1.p1 GENE.GHVQ01015191.1~~GHVQ01015191.1.p1  ORF type:complete len:263 (+),score=29.17 GHVQ01015191.1:200-988(+)